MAEHGYRLTPVTIGRLESGKKSAKFHKGWRHEAAWSADPDQLRAWWVDHPDCSFAIGGAANGIEGVDLDVKPGANAVEWWAAQGLPLSPFMQWTPSGGAHLIWRAGPDATLPQDVSAVAPGVDTRNRSGLFFAAGAYVLGEGGHYEVQGALPKLVDLPTTPPVVLDLFASAAARARPDRAVDGRIFVHDEDWQRQQVERALQAIRDHDRNAGGYRRLLQAAGLLYGRAVEQGFTTAERAEGAILDAHRSVWGDAIWPENLVTIRDALADGPRLERWRVSAAPSGGLETISPGHDQRPLATVNDHDHVHGSSLEPPNFEPSTDGVTAEAWPGEAGYDPDAKAEQRRQRADADAIETERRKRMARRVVAAEERDPVRVLGGLAFLSAPTPRYLVPRMLFADSTAKLYGAPGSTKSFLALDLVMHLVTGRAWRGHAIGRHRVHYVMAEGQAVNTVRALGWLHHHCPDLDHAEIDQWLRVVPQGVLLTPEGVAGYLSELETDRPALIVLDTKNAMMDGNENDASDVAVMVRSMRQLRDAAGGACVLLIDHTGIADESRGRGSNAVTAAMDTEIRVAVEGGIATAKVTRNKAAQAGASWSYRLHAVAGVPGLPPDSDTPAVCVEAQPGGADAWEVDDSWQTSFTPLPDDVSAFKGDGAKAIRQLARFMRSTDTDGVGFAFIDALRALQAAYVDERGKPMLKRDTVIRAWGALRGPGLGRLTPVGAGASELGRHVWVARPDDPS